MKIIACIVLSIVFYYGVVFNPVFLVGSMKACLYVGGLISAKEIYVFLIVKKGNPVELAKELGWGLFSYLMFVILIFLYFAALIYFIAF